MDKKKTLVTHESAEQLDPNVDDEEADRLSTMSPDKLPPLSPSRTKNLAANVEKEK